MAVLDSGKPLTELYALVDWDNVEQWFGRPNDPEDTAYRLRERLEQLARDRFPKVTEIDILCYSAWLEVSGGPTPKAQTIRPLIEALSSRSNSLTIRINCTDRMFLEGAPPIHAFLSRSRECRCRSKGLVREQKMVDTMIVADAATLAEYPTTAVVVVSDDVDLAPGVALAGSQRAFLTGQTSAADEIIWLHHGKQSRQVRLLEPIASIEEW